MGCLITRQDLTLVLTSDKGFTKKKGLIKWRNIPLPEAVLPDSNEFPAFLKESLDNFTENKNKTPIWTALEFSGLKIKNITIPDIPHGKITNAAFWGLKRETEFNEDREIFDFEILGDVHINGLKKKNLLVFSAPKKELQSIKRIFHLAGYPLAGITAIPFAIHNFIRTQQIRVDDPHFAIVNISRETSEIYCFSQSGILLVRNLRTGLQNLVEELDIPSDMESVDHLSFIETADSAGFSQMKDTSERLIGKIARTGDYCAQHYTGNTPIKKYIFYGETDQCDPFMELAEEMIPATVEILEPIRENRPGFVEAELPSNAKQRSSVLTAFGIGLSANDITPNFFFTFDDRQKAKKQKKRILATGLTGTLLLIVCCFVNAMLTNAHKENIATLAQINLKQTTIGYDVPKEAITRAISMAEATDLAKAQYISTYLPLAVIYEICHIPPGPIRLTSIDYYMEESKERSEESKEECSRKLSLEGEVSAHLHMLNSELDDYILKLSESPLFGYIEITSRQVKGIDTSQKLFFKVILEVL